MTKQPPSQNNLPSASTLVGLGSTAILLLLTIGIFAPGGFLDSLSQPPAEETATSESSDQHELLANEQEAEVSADMSPEKNAEYLAANAKKAGVKTTASGLQYRELTAGTGKQPGPTSMVTVHYKGTFINGKEFDSSYSRGEPISFPLDGVIAGWTEGLQLMKEGGKIELVIPQDLAYGRGRPGIPPYQTLVFQVELIKVQ